MPLIDSKPDAVALIYARALFDVVRTGAGAGGVQQAAEGALAELQQVLEEAHMSERQLARKQRLLAEERELLAQLAAMEGLIGQGQARLRAAEAGSATADVLSSNTAQALSNGSQPAYENSFETDDELSIGLESGVVSGSGALDSGRARARAGPGRPCRSQ